MKQLSWGNDGYLNDYEFYNRTEDLNLLTNLLDTTQYGSSPMILLTGIRRVGKTVLIKKLEEEFKDEYLVVYTDLRESNEYQNGTLTRADIIKIFYSKLIKSLEQKGLSSTIKRIEKFFTTNNLVIKELFEFKNIPVPKIGMEENYSKLVNYIVELPEQIYKENNDKIKGVIIFIDEIQVLKDLGNDLSSFLWYLRSKIQFQKNVTYLFSGSMSTRDDLINMLSGQEGAFGGRILNMEIKPFSKDTTSNYLKEKLPQLLLTQNACDKFYELTHGIPFYINLFANLMPKNIDIDENNILKYFNDYLPYLVSHYLITWGRLTLREQKIITSLLDKPLSRKEIANKFKVTQGSLGKPLNHLLNLVLIEYYESKYQIIDPILIYWLKQSYEEKGLYPYRDSLDY